VRMQRRVSKSIQTSEVSKDFGSLKPGGQYECLEVE
jgi:hypothetical protein